MSSKRIFSKMTVLASVAILSAVALFLYDYISVHSVAPLRYWYAPLSLWVILFACSYATGYRIFSLRNPEIVLWKYISGAIVWIVSAIFLFVSKGSIAQTFWTIVMGLSAGAIKASIERFKEDFEMVGLLPEERVSKESIRLSNRRLSVVSFFISLAVAPCLVALRHFIPSAEWLLLILIYITMYMGVVFAYNQPLDFRTREKLVNYVEYFHSDERIREDLRKKLVEPYRMRYGVKIISTSLRAILRLKIVGKENLIQSDLPAVFVCNHDAINGPVSAVTYLPTYYRVWVHDEMLEYDIAHKNISHTLRALPKVFGKYLGGKMIVAATKFTCWALNSFNPVPVRRGTSKEVITTFIVSLEALQDGDNLLIFPETPGKGEISQSSDNIRSFYTGFAHIGKVYYDKCGKSLSFYPVYIDKKRREFRIGEAVKYNPALDANESKQNIAAELHRQMTEFSRK